MASIFCKIMVLIWQMGVKCMQKNSIYVKPSLCKKLENCVTFAKNLLPKQHNKQPNFAKFFV